MASNNPLISRDAVNALTALLGTKQPPQLPNSTINGTPINQMQLRHPIPQLDQSPVSLSTGMDAMTGTLKAKASEAMARFQAWIDQNHPDETGLK